MYKSFIGASLNRFCIFFTFGIFTVSITFLVHQYVPVLNILFNNIEISAIPLVTIACLAIGSFIMSFCVELVCTENFFPHIKYIWRLAIVCIINTALFAVIALVTRWFPAGNIHAWVSLFFYVTVINLLWSGILIIKTKLEDRKDNKLLAEYKNKQKPHITNVKRNKN